MLWLIISLRDGLRDCSFSVIREQEIRFSRWACTLFLLMEQFYMSALCKAFLLYRTGENYHFPPKHWSGSGKV